MQTLFVVHVMATLYMVGLIWFVQLVHYPLFDHVGDQRFVDYQRQHMARTTWAVGPAMLTEMLGAVMLCLFPIPTLSPWAIWLAMALLVIIWISTALLQVPRHERLLSDGFDAHEHRRLVRSNWIRTVAWSMRGVLVTWMLAVEIVPS